MNKQCLKVVFVNLLSAILDRNFPERNILIRETFWNSSFQIYERGLMSWIVRSESAFKKCYEGVVGPKFIKTDSSDSLKHSINLQCKWNVKHLFSKSFHFVNMQYLMDRQYLLSSQSLRYRLTYTVLNQTFRST